jgi:hypothetical protein
MEKTLQAAFATGYERLAAWSDLPILSGSRASLHQDSLNLGL